MNTGGKRRAQPMPDAKFCLVFQRETLSVPVMRRVLGDTLRGLGVDEESVYDILLAATEACTNVLTHGGRKVRGYAVVTSLGAVGCQVEVADEGTGLQLRLLGAPGRSSPAGERWLAEADVRGLADALWFSGALPAQELSDALAACSVLICPDRSGPSSRKGSKPAV